MSFSIRLKKTEDGTYLVESTEPAYNPDEIYISGHVEGDQVVDLTARVPGMYVSGSRR